MPLSSVVGAQSIVKPGVCTSTTRPASPYVGQCIYETDTLLAKVWTGSAWEDYPAGKANIASPTFTGTPTLPTGTIATTQTALDSTTKVATTAFVTTADNLKANLASPTFTGTVSGISKTMVGLGSVDNTADTAKPVSTAQQTALNLKANNADPSFTGSVQQNLVHGNNFRQELAAGNNGAGTGVAQLNMWISEPGATWTGAGISRNRSNSAGSFPRVNTGLSAQMIRFADDANGNIVFYMINSAGTIENTINFDCNGGAYKPGGGSWSASSDIRLKNNVRDYNKGTAELMQVRVREWEYNGKGGLQAGFKGLGVVADEIELILPDTVSTYEGKLNREDEETTEIKGVNATEITWLLVKTVQEQQAVIEQLTARIEALEAR